MTEVPLVGRRQGHHAEDDRIKQWVMMLAPRCREILTMFYYHDMTLEEIQAERPETQV